MNTWRFSHRRDRLHEVRVSWHRCLVVFIALSVLLRFAIPTYFAFGAIHDDELMVRMAGKILAHTQSAWDQFAIQKEPGYAYFLALLIKLKVSPVIAVHLLTMASTYVLFLVLRSVVSEAHSAICAILIVINPALFGVGASRIYNVSFQTSLVAGLLAVSARFVFLLKSQTTARRQAFFAAFILFGIVGAMAITRPDWIFIAYPLLGSIAVTNLRNRTQLWFRNLCLLLILASISIIPAASKELVRISHERTYGVHLVNDVNEGNFKEMMQSLARIEPRSESSFVVVSKVALREAERISPTFSQMSRFLKGRDSELWMSITCDAGGPCDEIAGGYLPLMLRDGLIQSFPGANASDFQTISKRIANEIDLACRLGEISCGERGTGAWLPSVQNLDFKLSMLEFVRLLFSRSYSFKDRITFRSVTDSSRASIAAAPTWEIIESDLVGLRGVSRGGTPEILQHPISELLSFISLTIRLYSLIGALLFLRFAMKFRHDMHLVGIGFGMLAAVLVLTSFYSVMYVNSFGTSVDGGNLAYLMMVQPLAICVACIGFHFAFHQIRLRNRERTQNFRPREGND